MRMTSEAPVAEPQPVQRAATTAAGGSDAPAPATQAASSASGAAVEIRGLAHAFGPLRVIERLAFVFHPLAELPRQLLQRQLGVAERIGGVCGGMP